VIYNTPTLQNMERLVRDTFGSWEVGSIVSITSGASYTPVINSVSNLGDPSGIGNGAGVQFPNIVPGQPCRNPSFKGFQWVNPNRYTMNGFKLGTIGNAPIGDCLGPPTRTVDTSLAKNVRLTERIRVQFRIDAFNLFNHPQYTTPGGGSNQSTVNLGFNGNCGIVNGVPVPPSQGEFLDANGNPVVQQDPITHALFASCSPVGMGGQKAVSLQNLTPNPVVGTVTTVNDRSREFQYSVRFTF
jgi:hypothetical protein